MNADNMLEPPDEIPDSGAVFTFGKTWFADNIPSHFFIKNDPIVAISCGDQHSAVICQEGRVFVFGGNECGQLGLGHAEPVARPSCVKWIKPQRAAFVACGRAHTIFVTENNNIYTCGNNGEGQLGTGSAEDQTVPQLVELQCDGAKIKQISAGSNHTAILTDSGRVFVCGSNSEGQLGLGDDVKNCLSLTEISFMESLSYVECGYYHTIFITAEGAVFICGDNEGQRLGLGDPAPRIYIPKLLPIDVPIKGACSGIGHTFLLSKDESKILAFGSNEQGQLGLPQAVVEVNEPTEMCIDKMFDGHRLKLIACGATHTAFVTDTGLLYTCGDNRHYKLCHDEETNSSNSNEQELPFQYLPRHVTLMDGFNVDNVACGGCHTLLTASKIPDHDFIEDLTQTVTNSSRLMAPSSEHELPPLQKVPISILQRTNATDLAISASKQVETVEKSDFMTDAEHIAKAVDDIIDSKSLDSLIANVSGSHVVDIYDDHNTNEQKKDDSNTVIVAQDLAELVETTEQLPQSTTEITQLKEVLQVPENSEKLDSPPPKTPIIPELLQIPTLIQKSPGVSTKSGTSQKSETTSRSENETMLCYSDKSSPQVGKTAKTQAVMPIVRSGDNIDVSTIDTNEDKEIVTEKIPDKGRFSRMFQAMKDTEHSCMRKGKVIETEVIENVDTAISKTEQTLHNAEDSVVEVVHNQTNSRTCAIL